MHVNHMTILAQIYRACQFSCVCIAVINVRFQLTLLMADNTITTDSIITYGQVLVVVCNKIVVTYY